MLEIKNLTKKYGKFLAVDDITIRVYSGEVGVLLGPNGAGKSTIIKCIAGLLRYNGEIYVDGLPNRSIEAKKILGFVPEIPYNFKLLTVRQHLEYVAHLYGTTDFQSDLKELLKRFDLHDKQDKFGDELSKGMTQKVSIIANLLIKPKVILLDEPMVGLDPKAIRELKNAVLELKEAGCTVLISTHMLDMVEQLWDRVFIMNKSKIIKEFTKEEIASEKLESVFLEVTEEQQ